MKKIFLTTLLLTVALGAQAGGQRGYAHHSYGGSGGYRGHGGYGGYGGPRVSFYWGGGYPCYSPWSSYSYSYYPSYGYDYGYSRPNYAVNGTLTGALLGGIIGDSVHGRGWEGAGIGAAAGLVLGSLAEHNARAYERNYYAAPTVSYAQPNSIADAPTVNVAPTVPDAPRVQTAPVYKPVSAMSSANSLFGR